MKFCMECGAPAEDSQKYCRVCGHKFPEMDPPGEETQPPEEDQEETEIVLDHDDDQPEEWTERVACDADSGWDGMNAGPGEEEATGQVDAGGFQPEEEDPGETVYIPQEEEDSPESRTARVPYDPEDEAGQAGAGYQEDAPGYPEEDDAGKTRKKSLPMVGIGVAAAALVLCVGAGAWMLLRSGGDSSEVLIGGQSYVISRTDTLVAEDPDQEDWNNIACLTGLTSLTIRGDGETTAVTAEDLQLLRALPDLTDLELEGVQLESMEDLDLLDHLEVLAVRNAGLDSEQCMDLPALENLTGLDLRDNGIQDLAFLAKFPGLTELNLSGNPITDYTPLSACTGLRSLSVDRCQAGVIGQLDSLEELSVEGKPVEDLPAFLEEQKNTAELYDSVMEWFDQDDFETIEVALAEYDPSDGVMYANGWLMDLGSGWEEIRSALPEGTMAVVLDDSGIYYGEMDQDQRSGQGTLYLPDSKSWYRGSWSGNLPNGSGSYYKPAPDGRTLEFAGSYLNGYEDGPMNMVLHNGSSIQSVAYTSQQGTRTTLQQLSDTQYAFAYLDGVYWCDAQPGGHGVPLNGIAYQQEQPVTGTQPAAEAPAAEAADHSGSASSSKSSGGSASSKSSGKTSGGKSSGSKSSGGSSSSAAPAQPSAPAPSSTPAQTPAPAAPAAPETPDVPDTMGQQDLQSMMQDAEAYAQQLLEGLEQ